MIIYYECDNYALKMSHATHWHCVICIVVTLGNVHYML